MPVALREEDIELPDLLTELQDRTQLTRRSLVRILVESGRLSDFRRNPQGFIDSAAAAINKRKQLAIVDGIKYERIGDESYFAQELFLEQELTGYVRNMLENATKCVYESVVYQSETERTFADRMEHNNAIRVYAKLPAWFKVPTPLGPYNPDWAILVRTDDEERLYFVVETKGTLWVDDLRDTESAKIRCGEAHFEALRAGETPAQYIVARDLDGVLDVAMADQ